MPRQSSWGKVFRGEELPQTRLTEADVVLIRQAYQEHLRIQAQADELSPSALAKKFEISRNQVYRIVNYSDWKHVGA